MFCLYCGNKIEQGDLYCGNCGHKIPSIIYKKAEKKQNKMLSIITDVKLYLFNPSKLCTEEKVDKKLKISCLSLIILSLLTGLFTMIFKISLVNILQKNIAKVPEFLSKYKVISSQEASSMAYSSNFTSFKSLFDSVITNNSSFFQGVTQLVVIILLTLIIFEISNIFIFNNELRPENIMIISSFSFISVTISLLIAAFVIKINLAVGIFILILGPLFSFPRMYRLLTNLSANTSNKKGFILTCIISEIVLIIFLNTQLINNAVSVINLLRITLSA